MLRIKRTREAPAKTDGVRFLVERLWPRGVKKSELKFAVWLKEAAPSTELRKWFNHDPEKWEEFKRRYGVELDQRPEARQPILDAEKEGNVTLFQFARRGA